MFHHFCITFSSLDFTLIFHWFLDGFCIDFPSFLDVKLAPLPNLANLLNWNKYRTRALFYDSRELRFFTIFLSFSVSDFIPTSTYFWTSFFITFGARNREKSAPGRRHPGVLGSSSFSRSTLHCTSPSTSPFQHFAFSAPIPVFMFSAGRFSAG